MESPLKFSRSKSLCSVSYAALNFRDVMLATGRLPPDAIPGDLAQQDCILGMEFSGYNTEGKKVAGLVPAKVSADKVCKAKVLNSNFETFISEHEEEITIY